MGAAFVREFAFDPTGKYLIAANQMASTVTVFSVDAATGKKPALGRAAIRTLVPIALPLVSSSLNHVVPHRLDTLTELVIAGGCGAVPLALIWASLRSLNKQTIWDRASHTLVRYRTRRTNAI